MANVTDDLIPQPEVQEPAKSRGCLYGCLFVGVAMVAMTLCAGIGGYWFVSSTVAKYTSDTPVKLPSVEYSPEQLAALEARLKTFTDTVQAGDTPEEDLVLTADEINALISKEEKLRGKVFIKISDGRVSGDVSIPTDAIPGGQGRYFNGSASFNVSMGNGVLIVTLADAEANGQQVPQHVIDGMAAENLAKDLYKDPKNAEMLRRIDSVSIEEDKIVLKFKGGESAGEESETDADLRASTPSDDSPAPDEAAADSPAPDQAAPEPADAESSSSTPD